MYGIESYIAVPLRRRDGSFFGTLCALDPLPHTLEDSAFDIFHLLATLIAYELEQAEIQRKREAEIQALEDFLAIAGHDLSQPLASLYGHLQLLQRTLRSRHAEPDVLNRMDVVLAHARTTVSLSTTLLDVARMEVGTFTLAPQWSEVVRVVQQVLQDVQVVAPAHQFQLDAPPTLHAWLDPIRLGQAVRNLVQNAAKYAPAEYGPVQIRLWKDERASPPTLSVQVQDQGIGVEDADLPHLFERHYRASTATSMNIGGTGLGMYIVHQIVQAHSGTVSANHTEGGGLTVTIQLPLKETPPSE